MFITILNEDYEEVIINCDEISEVKPYINNKFIKYSDEVQCLIIRKNGEVLPILNSFDYIKRVFKL